MKYFARKFGFFLLTLWAVVTLNFFIPRLQGVNPVEKLQRNLLGKDAQIDPAQLQALEAMLGAPKGSLWSQYWSYVGNLLRGDFGISYTYFPFSVTEVIGKAFWWTVGLVTIVYIVSFVVGVVLGAFAAWKRNSMFDSVVSIGSTFVGTLNPFWIALILLSVFAYGFGWFPADGGYSQSTPGFSWDFAYDVISHAALPAVVLLIVTPIGWILGMRNTMVLNLGDDYIRLARAKGLPNRTVALKYAARNALLPSITGFAIALGGVLGGAILVETAFDYPGLGRLMGEAVQNSDYPLLQTLMLLTTVATLLANLIADLLYGVLDPRARKADA